VSSGILKERIRIAAGKQQAATSLSLEKPPTDFRSDRDAAANHAMMCRVCNPGYQSACKQVINLILKLPLPSSGKGQVQGYLIEHETTYTHTKNP
jgi:hypothetical protein